MSSPPVPTPPWRVHASAAAACDMDAPLDRVWALLCDVQRWPQWNPAVVRAKADRSLAPGTRFVWKSGGVAIVSTVEHVVPGRQLVWSGRALGTKAWHTWALQALPGRVHVTTSEHFGGWLPRCLPGTMQAMLARALPQWLAHLERAAQAGTPTDGADPRQPGDSTVPD